MGAIYHSKLSNMGLQVNLTLNRKIATSDPSGGWWRRWLTVLSPLRHDRQVVVAVAGCHPSVFNLPSPPLHLTAAVVRPTEQDDPERCGGAARGRPHPSWYTSTQWYSTEVSGIRHTPTGLCLRLYRPIQRAFGVM